MFDSRRFLMGSLIAVAAFVVSCDDIYSPLSDPYVDRNGLPPGKIPIAKKELNLQTMEEILNRVISTREILHEKGDELLGYRTIDPGKLVQSRSKFMFDSGHWDSMLTGRQEMLEASLDKYDRGHAIYPLNLAVTYMRAQIKEYQKAVYGQVDGIDPKLDGDLLRNIEEAKKLLKEAKAHDRERFPIELEK